MPATENLRKSALFTENFSQRSWARKDQDPKTGHERLAQAWGVVCALLLHGAIVALLLSMEVKRTPIEPPRPMWVSLVQVPEPKPPAPVVEPPEPEPVVRRPPPRPQPKPTPNPQPVQAPDSAPAVQPTPAAPIIASDAPSSTAVREAPANPAPNPVPPAPVAEAPAPEPPSAPLSEPRFDAAYLNNPAPAYPSLSRRLGEQGRVLVRVHVDAQGIPTSVVLRASSGHERLDTVALDTVRRWKFVPARRGAEPVSAWVIVPIVFNLRS